MSTDAEMMRYARKAVAGYEPETLFQKVLARLMPMPGYVGRSATRKLMRRAQKRHTEAFDAALQASAKGALAIDLGANAGDFTQKMLDAGLRVIAFEPDPDTFASLEARFAGQANVTLMNKAAGAKAAVMTLMRDLEFQAGKPKRAMGSSLVFRGETMDKSNTVEVEVVDFPALVLEQGERVAILKMDIEGSEWDLVPAMVDTGALDQVDYMFVETHEWRDLHHEETARGFREMAENRKSPVMNFDWM